MKWLLILLFLAALLVTSASVVPQNPYKKYAPIYGKWTTTPKVFIYPVTWKRVDVASKVKEYFQEIDANTDLNLEFVDDINQANVIIYSYYLPPEKRGWDKKAVVTMTNVEVLSTPSKFAYYPMWLRVPSSRSLLGLTWTNSSQDDEIDMSMMWLNLAGMDISDKSFKNTVQHELLHVAGLDHIKIHGMLMYPSDEPQCNGITTFEQKVVNWLY